jgi:hypothetical protein
MVDPPPITFRTWLLTRARATDTKAGNLVHEARDDPRFPEIDNREQLIGYLRLRCASPAAIEGVDPLWARWRDYRRRKASSCSA